jgi:UDP-glucose 4-epimerase
MENIEHIKTLPSFHYHLDSVTNQRLIAELVDLCDLVYHLAAAVGVRLIVESPVRTIETNIRGTEIVLSHAAKKRKRVLITSTSEVYGKRDRVPFREDDDLVMGPTDKGRWSYACSKAIDEFLAIAYWKEKKVPTVIARLFNTVGPRQTGRYGMVIPNFVGQALKAEEITVFGDGTQSRCFTHVSDVVGALMQLIEHPNAIGEVYNIGGDHEVTILQLAEKIKQMTGSASRIVFLPYDQAYEEGFEDMLRRVPDISKISDLIGYQPKFNLDEILMNVIDYQRKKMASRHGAPAPIVFQ